MGALACGAVAALVVWGGGLTTQECRFVVCVVHTFKHRTRLLRVCWEDVLLAIVKPFKPKTQKNKEGLRDVRQQCVAMHGALAGSSCARDPPLLHARARAFLPAPTGFVATLGLLAAACRRRRAWGGVSRCGFQTRALSLAGCGACSKWRRSGLSGTRNCRRAAERAASGASVAGWILERVWSGSGTATASV